MIRIVEASQDQVRALNRIDATFLVDSKLALRLDHGRLSYTVVPIAAYTRAYPQDEIGPGAAGLAATLIALSDDRHVGRIDLSKHWNGFAFIDNIVVDRVLRRSGVATALIRHAQAWSELHGLAGVMAETQHTNVAACKLYERCGFQLSGFDSDLYRAQASFADEVALFWYWHSKAHARPAA